MASAAISSPPPLPSSAPPPNSNQRRTSSGILHNVKRAVFGPNKSTIDDSEFKAAHDDFNTLNGLLLTLRSNVAQYNKATVTLSGSARATTHTFADIMKDAAPPNPYSTTLLASTHAHNELVEQVEASGVYTREVLAVVEQQTEAHRVLSTRIDERAKLRTDFLYYQHKVEGLQKEREDRSLKGRAEKPAETEKYDRNNQKLNDSGDRYRIHNAELMHDLQMLYISRLRTYGPCFNQFVSAERRFSSVYYACMHNVDKDDGGRQLDELSINASASFDQRVVVVPAEHSSMPDQRLDRSPLSNPFDMTPSPIGGLTPTNAMCGSAGVPSASSASAFAHHSRNTASHGDGASLLQYPYDQHNGSGEAVGHGWPAASAPMQSPPARQPFSFNPPQWTEQAATAGGPRVDVYSDPFANAAVNPFDDLDEFAAVATPAQTQNRKPSFSSFPSPVRPTPSSAGPAVPQYQPAPYVPPPALVVSPVVVSSPAVVEPTEAELEAAVEDDKETDEDAEGADLGAAVEEEQEGIPSSAAVHISAPATAAPPTVVVVGNVQPSQPANSVAALATPPLSFAAMHTAAAPRPPAVPTRLPTSLPPSPPTSRPVMPSSKPVQPVVQPVQWLGTVAPPRSPQSAEQSENPFDDD